MTAPPVARFPPSVIVPVFAMPVPPHPARSTPPATSIVPVAVIGFGAVERQASAFGAMLVTVPEPLPVPEHVTAPVVGLQLTAPDPVTEVTAPPAAGPACACAGVNDSRENDAATAMTMTRERKLFMATPETRQPA